MQSSLAFHRFVPRRGSVVTLFSLLLWMLTSAAHAKPLVVASIQPLSLFAEEFFGNQVTVRTLLLPSQNPHQVSFTPQQLALVQQADLVIWLGADAEPYLVPYLAHRRRPVLALLQQPGVTPLREAGGQAADLDPHLWLNPEFLVRMLPNLIQAGTGLGLSQTALTQQANTVQSRLVSLVSVARQRVQPVANVPWLSYHNPWHYLQVLLKLTPPLTVEEQLGVETGSRHFLELASAMQQQKVRCGLLEPEARRAVMEKLCQGPTCHLLALDPLGRDAPQGSYSQWWQGVVNQMQQCLAAPTAR